jgi:hypothetical protein
MKAIEKINWETADLDKVIGDYIPMLDGSEHYIELDLLHWNLLQFMMERGDAYQEMIKDTLEAAAGVTEFFDVLIREGIFTFNREYIRIATGR